MIRVVPNWNSIEKYKYKAKSLLFSLYRFLIQKATKLQQKQLFPHSMNMMTRMKANGRQKKKRKSTIGNQGTMYIIYWCVMWIVATAITNNGSNDDEDNEEKENYTQTICFENKISILQSVNFSCCHLRSMDGVYTTFHTKTDLPFRSRMGQNAHTRR